MGEEAIEDVVGAVLEYVLRNAGRIWVKSGFSEDSDRFAASLYAYMKQGVQWQAIERMKKERKKTDFRDTESEDEEGNYVRPTTVVWPEQEDVVFRKQMIEQCDRLPAEEREAARLIFEGASLRELVNELGVSPKDAQRRVTEAARGLRAKLASPGGESR